MQPQHFARKPLAQDSPNRIADGAASRDPARGVLAPGPRRAAGGASERGATLRVMPLGPLGVTALLAALDWGAWDWATNSNQTTVGLIAGLLMAPIAVAFTWSLARVLVALVRRGLSRLTAEARVVGLAPVLGASAAPFDIEADSEQQLAA